MSDKPYHGPFQEMIGSEDLLRPTPARVTWLLVGLVGALGLGFVLGLMRPRMAQRFPGQPLDDRP